MIPIRPQTPTPIPTPIALITKTHISLLRISLNFIHFQTHLMIYGAIDHQMLHLLLIQNVIYLNYYIVEEAEEEVDTTTDIIMQEEMMDITMMEDMEVMLMVDITIMTISE